MADQTFHKVEGIVTDAPVKINDHFIPTDFQVIDMGEDEYDPPVILGRPFLSTVKANIYIGTGEVVILDFKDKIRYAPYVSFRSQISHIATIKG